VVLELELGSCFWFAQIANPRQLGGIISINKIV